MDISWKTPLSTLKREEVSVGSDRMRKSIVEKVTVPVVGLMVNTGVFTIDWTDFFVFSSPETVSA